MKKFALLLAAAALSMTPINASTVLAQPAGSVVCEARSNSAIGIGNAWTRPTACQRALYECAVRTPNNDVCVVTRWWHIV